MILTINPCLCTSVSLCCSRLEWSLLSDEDVPGVLPAQGPELRGGQRGLPVGQGAEGAVHKVHPGEPGHNQGTEHALEQHRSGIREGKKHSGYIKAGQTLHPKILCLASLKANDRVWSLLEKSLLSLQQPWRKNCASPVQESYSAEAKYLQR